MIKSICVFCGSSMGADPSYAEGARRLAALMLKRSISLVYGGANVGLMQVIADAMLAGGGEVTGVMPRSLVDREVAHDHLTRMHIVPGMQERKALMAELCDAFVALPGAFGTFDELFEVLTWNQLGIVVKPIGLINLNGYFDPLIAMADHAVAERFLRPEHRKILQVADDEVSLLSRLEAWHPETAEKWIEGLKAGGI